MLISNEYLQPLIDLAFKEDIGDGDHSTLSSIPVDHMGKSHLLIKEDGILAGVDIALEVFKKFDDTLEVEVFIKDGSEVKVGDVAFIVTGKTQSILQTERIVLNIMQRMSGIATNTSVYTKLIDDLPTQLLGTRKTTPGLRYLEKLAIKLGGGGEHRMGLFDMIMLKDNHIDFAGGITNAVKKAQAYLKEKGKDLNIEVEVRNLDELDETLAVGGVYRVMFDNFDTDLTKKAVEIVNGRIQTESSGGITLKTLRSYAECGVDFISVGALTHSAASLDMSLKAI